jgi:hypothetical protein
MAGGRHAVSEVPSVLSYAHCERVDSGPGAGKSGLERQRRECSAAGMPFALVMGEPRRSPNCETGERRWGTEGEV